MVRGCVWTQTLGLEDGIITAIEPRQGEDRGEDLSQNGARALITPGLIDLQVNGGAGLMLADCQTTEDISRLAAAHRPGGTLGLLPTLISDTPETTTRMIDLVAKAATQDPAVRGLHLEGPHLARAGVHPPDLLRPHDAKRS